MTNAFDDLTPADIITDICLFIALIIAFIRGKPPKE